MLGPESRSNDFSHLADNSHSKSPRFSACSNRIVQLASPGFVYNVKGMKVRSSDFVQTKPFSNFHENYTLGKKIGEGSYGRVHMATNNQTKIVRAIKLMKL